MVTIKYNVTAKIYTARGKFIGMSRGKNLVVNTGLQAIRDLFAGPGSRADQMQAGTGTSATTATMTALQTTVITKDIIRYIQKTYGVEVQALIGTSEANGYTLSEVGTFQQSVMFARALLDPVINKTSAIQVTMSHVFTFSATT